MKYNEQKIRPYYYLSTLLLVLIFCCFCTKKKEYNDISTIKSLCYNEIDRDAFWPCDIVPHIIIPEDDGEPQLPHSPEKDLC